MSIFSMRHFSRTQCFSCFVHVQRLKIERKCLLKKYIYERDYDVKCRSVFERKKKLRISKHQRF